MRKILALMMVVLNLSGCAEPLNEDKLEYVGLWKSNQTSLLISQSGRLEYETNKGAVSTSVSMPIKSIENDRIEAGFLFFSSSFELGGNPFVEDGLHVLIVDGEKLFKTDKTGNIPKATVIPSLVVIRTLVHTDLMLLSRGFVEKDFSDYLENTALLYQSHFSNERLLESYRAFIDRKIDLKDWMVGDFVLTREPYFDEDGILKVHGKYLTAPNSLKFKLGFIYTHPDWKSMGGKIDINEG